MVFSDTTYSVLIVSGSEKFSEAVSALLPPSACHPVHTARTAAEARLCTRSLAYDLVFISCPLEDEFGNRFAAELCRGQSASVLLLVRGESYGEICASATGKGIMVLPKPLAPQAFSQALQMMCAARERLRKAEEKQSTVDDQIRELKLISHAKSLLIECLSMTENDAHKYIEQQAMDLRLTRREVAENIIKTYR